MKTYCLLLAIVQLASAGVLAADPSPVVFAHSGQKVTVPVGSDAKEGSQLALTAFGKRWGEPATVKGGAAEFVAPEVRAPMAFRPAAVADGKIISGELVVYPEQWLPWDTDPALRKLMKDTQFAAAGVPDWLDTWLAAVGFKAERLSGPEQIETLHWRMLEKPGLLMVGRKAAGDSPADTAKLAADYSVNVLVLEADWFGTSETAGKDFALRPKRGRAQRPNVEGQDQYAPPVFRGALSDLETQDWPLPPVFRQYAAALAGNLEPLDMDRRRGVSAGGRDSPSAEGRGSLADGGQLLALAGAAWPLRSGR